MRQNDKVVSLLEPVVEAMGYEFVGVEYFPSSNNGVLRLFIDKPDGILVEDCAAVSHQVSGVLDVEDPIAGHYTLEVSSPGMDRPLFKLGDFDRFSGERVKVRLHAPLEGRRKFEGVIQGTRDGNIVLQEQDTEWVLEFGLIDKAKLVPDFSAGARRQIK